jgi:hypothetical protein
MARRLAGGCPAPQRHHQLPSTATIRGAARVWVVRSIAACPRLRQHGAAVGRGTLTAQSLCLALCCHYPNWSLPNTHTHTILWYLPSTFSRCCTMLPMAIVFIFICVVIAAVVQTGNVNRAFREALEFDLIEALRCGGASLLPHHTYTTPTTQIASPPHPHDTNSFPTTPPPPKHTRAVCSLCVCVSPTLLSCAVPHPRSHSRGSLGTVACGLACR